MDETILQSHLKKNRACVEHTDNIFDFVTENTSPLNNTQHLIQSLESGEISNGIISYSHAFNAYFCDFLNVDYLEIFIDSLIQKSRDLLTANIFNLNDIFCVICGDVLLDPVALKCGHTFSKQCAMLKSKGGVFNCLECGENYTYSYLSQLKNNIVITEFIHKIWNDKRNALYTLLMSIISETSVFICRYVTNPSPRHFLKKANFLVSLDKHIEAVYLYLIYCIFVPSDVDIKKHCIVLLHKLLLQCHKSLPSPATPPTKYEVKLVFLRSSGLKRDLYLLMIKLCKSIEEIAQKSFLKDMDNVLLSDKHDFDCSLCMQLFLEPVATPCGHTFCRVCLDRWLDHQPACPLCKATLKTFLAEPDRDTNEFIELAIKDMFPEDYAERETLYIRDITERFYPERKQEHFIPLFVCTVAFPTILCPLHIFEPRYKLMLRQCIESGFFKFGMCASIENNISEFGTMLEIEDVRSFDDGRSVAYTIGNRRFRIIKKGERDGYNTGVVEYLKDTVFDVDDDFIEMHDLLYDCTLRFYRSLPEDRKEQILLHFGVLPEKESNYFSDPNGPSWVWWILAILPIERKLQLMILSMTSLHDRLSALKKMFFHLNSLPPGQQ